MLHSDDDYETGTFYLNEVECKRDTDWDRVDL